jgi:hypothetical protein
LRNKEVVMTQERLTVRKIKEILRLKYEMKLTNRAIAGACKVSNSTVGEYLKRAVAAGVSWPLGEIGEEELYRKFFPEQKEVPPKREYPIPNGKKALPCNCCGRSTKENTRKGINTPNIASTTSAGRKAG